MAKTYTQFMSENRAYKDDYRNSVFINELNKLDELADQVINEAGIKTAVAGAGIFLRLKSKLNQKDISIDDKFSILADMMITTVILNRSELLRALTTVKTSLAKDIKNASRKR